MRLVKGLQFVLADDAHADQPLYRRIYLRLREAIEDGVLTAGTRLPSTRTLAQDLKVSRNTIAAAFDQLHADGYLNQRVGDGTYVAPLPQEKRRHLPDADLPVLADADAPAAGWDGGGRVARGKRSGRISTGGKSGPHSDGRAKPLTPASALPSSLTAQAGGLAGSSQPGFSQRGGAFDPTGMVAAAMEPVCMLARPGVDLFPRGQWRQVMNEVINSRRADGFDVCDPAGHPDLRKAVARHLAISRGLICDASQVIITTSGLQSVDLAIRVITDPGNQAWIEDPGCTETRATMLSAGLEIVAVPVDAQGIDVDYGRQMAPKAKLVYVTPHHQFPSGRAMSLERRRALADWADRADAWVIEDEFDGDLLDPGTRLPCLQRLRHGRKTIHVGHFGLSLFPSVGVGYLVVPAGSAKRFAQAKRMIDGPASALNQLAVARFIDCGYFDAHLRRMRHCYAERRAAIVKALAKHAPYLHAVDDVATGLHLTLALNPQEARAAGAIDDDRQLMAAAAQAGHQIPAVAAYVIKHRQLQGLVLGYAGIPAAQAEKVATQLGQAFQQGAFQQGAFRHGARPARYA
ncbi:MAG TPA: PLP-dependent aminotransferase family protein [Dongiaceae bacterium]|nr:PLP-dependent aminotransferase family protein [Dongiaceae bacterium]